MRIQELKDELERQRPLKWDKKINASEIEMILENNTIMLHIKALKKEYSITQPCHSQIADRLGIPAKYYKKMEDEAPDLLTENVNTWLKQNGKEFFVRGMGESVRALLSDRYRVIDHIDVLYVSLNELQTHETEIEDCHLSETEMYVKAKSNKLKEFVRHREDIIIGGLLLTNSETGHKALRLEPRLFRVLCTNGMVIEDLKTRQIHLGNGDTFFDNQVYLSIRQSIRELFGQFGDIIQNLRDTSEIKVNNPRTVIRNVVEHYQLSEVQKENILMAFGSDPEHDKLGIADAVTRAAQKEKRFEDRIDMEKLGGKVISLPNDQFRRFDDNMGSILKSSNFNGETFSN